MSDFDFGNTRPQKKINGERPSIKGFVYGFTGNIADGNSHKASAVFADAAAMITKYPFMAGTPDLTAINDVEMAWLAGYAAGHYKPDGLRIWFPSGCYFMDRTLPIDHNRVHFVGYGQFTTRISFQPIARSVPFTSTAGSPIITTPTRNHFLYPGDLVKVSGDSAFDSSKYYMVATAAPFVGNPAGTGTGNAAAKLQLCATQEQDHPLEKILIITGPPINAAGGTGTITCDTMQAAGVIYNGVDPWTLAAFGSPIGVTPPVVNQVSWTGMEIVSADDITDSATLPRVGFRPVDVSKLRLDDFTTFRMCDPTISSVGMMTMGREFLKFHDIYFQGDHPIVHARNPMAHLEGQVGEDLDMVTVRDWTVNGGAGLGTANDHTRPLVSLCGNLHPTQVTYDSHGSMNLGTDGFYWDASTFTGGGCQGLNLAQLRREQPGINGVEFSSTPITLAGAVTSGMLDGNPYSVAVNNTTGINIGYITIDRGNANEEKVRLRGTPDSTHIYAIFTKTHAVGASVRRDAYSVFIKGAPAGTFDVGRLDGLTITNITTGLGAANSDSLGGIFLRNVKNVTIIRPDIGTLLDAINVDSTVEGITIKHPLYIDDATTASTTHFTNGSPENLTSGAKNLIIESKDAGRMVSRNSAPVSLHFTNPYVIDNLDYYSGRNPELQEHRLIGSNSLYQVSINPDTMKPDGITPWPGGSRTNIGGKLQLGDALPYSHSLVLPRGGSLGIMQSSYLQTSVLLPIAAGTGVTVTPNTVTGMEVGLAMDVVNADGTNFETVTPTAVVQPTTMVPAGTFTANFATAKSANCVITLKYLAYTTLAESVGNYGYCDVNGTACKRRSAPPFTSTMALQPILINGVLNGCNSVTDGDNLVLQSSAGIQNNVVFISAGNQTVTPASMVGIHAPPAPGPTQLFVVNADGTNGQTVFPDHASSTTFTATFAKPLNAGAIVNIVLNSDSVSLISSNSLDELVLADVKRTVNLFRPRIIQTEASAVVGNRTQVLLCNASAATGSGCETNFSIYSGNDPVYTASGHYAAIGSRIHFNDGTYASGEIALFTKQHLALAMTAKATMDEFGTFTIFNESLSTGDASQLVLKAALNQSTKNLIEAYSQPFTTAVLANISTGSQTVTPASMGTGASAILAGQNLTIDTGASKEVVNVTAVTSTTFTATFTIAHTNPVAVEGVRTLGFHVGPDGAYNTIFLVSSGYGTLPPSPNDLFIGAGSATSGRSISFAFGANDGTHGIDIGTAVSGVFAPKINILDTGVVRLIGGYGAIGVNLQDLVFGAGGTVGADAASLCFSALSDGLYFNIGTNASGTFQSLFKFKDTGDLELPTGHLKLTNALDAIYGGTGNTHIPAAGEIATGDGTKMTYLSGGAEGQLAGITGGVLAWRYPDVLLGGCTFDGTNFKTTASSTQASVVRLINNVVHIYSNTGLALNTVFTPTEQASFDSANGLKLLVTPLACAFGGTGINGAPTSNSLIRSTGSTYAGIAPNSSGSAAFLQQAASAGGFTWVVSDFISLTSGAVTFADLPALATALKATGVFTHTHTVTDPNHLHVDSTGHNTNTSGTGVTIASAL